MTIIDQSLKWELKQNAIFRNLDDAAFEEVLSAARPHAYKARKVIFHEGDPGGSLLMVLSGQLKISSVSANGKECVLAFINKGDIIGEITLLDGGPRTATAETMEASNVLELSRSSFLTMAEAHPSAMVEIVQILCQRLRATSRMVEDAALAAAAPRLARVLLRLAQSNGVESDAGIVIDLNLSQSTLGAHAGLLRESVNRQLRKWKSENVITRQSDRIVILDRAALQAACDLS